MTSYTIEIGYNSGYSQMHPYKSKDNQWACLKETVTRICNDTQRIIDDAKLYGAPDIDRHGNTLSEAAEMCKDGNPNGFHFYENQGDNRFRMYVSGDRELKEHVRRAICRLVILDMHKLGIEVCLRVS
jgi:hypothetical protein